MNPQLTDPRWSTTQRQFLTALEAAGANKPEYAVPIDKVPAPPVRELQALLDLGVVREAAANGYYLYPRQILALDPTNESTSSTVRPTRVPAQVGPRMIKAMVFWILVLLIPILLITISKH